MKYKGQSGPQPYHRRSPPGERGLKFVHWDLLTLLPRRSPHGERRLKFNVCRQTLLGAEKIHMILMQREHKVSTRFVADICA